MRKISKGFTIIEVTLVLILISILISVTTPILSSIINRADLNTSHESLYNSLIRAQNLSRIQYRDQQWRVCIDNIGKQYIIAAGTCSSPLYAETIKFSSNITVSSTQTLDLQFTSPKGELNYTGNFSKITLISGGVSKYIIVNQNGVIDKDTSTSITIFADGSSADKAAPSASHLISLGITTDGVYWINLPTIGPTQVYCILNPIYDGGGWMMAMKATTGTTFNYNSNYWTTANTLNPTDTTRNNADAKFNTMNYFQAKDMMAIWPDILNQGNESGSIDNLSNWTWLENNFNDSTRIAPIDFFNISYPTMTNSGSGKFIRDAKTFSGWASGRFSSQKDIRFYGFNYKNNPTYFGNSNRGVRWGFGWNENGEGLYPGIDVGGVKGSNDVFGGIGMDSGAGNYSAGDFISCCQDNTGINRSARVEVYIR